MKNQTKVNKYHLWVHFCQAYDLLYGCKQEFHAKSNVTGEQFHVLWSIKYMTETNGEPVILSRLAYQLYRNINSVSELVNRMEKAGLIKKIKDLPDKRAVRLELTPKGETIFSKSAKPNLKFVDKIFTTFSEREIETFLKLIKKLKKSVREDFHYNKSVSNPILNDPANIDRFLDKL